MIYINSSGRIALQMTKRQAISASHSGSCDADVLALSKVPKIAKQLQSIDKALLAKELREFGCWTEADLSNHDDNLQRILWIAAGDIADNLA